MRLPPASITFVAITEIISLPFSSKYYLLLHQSIYHKSSSHISTFFIFYLYGENTQNIIKKIMHIPLKKLLQTVNHPILYAYHYISLMTVNNSLWCHNIIYRSIMLFTWYRINNLQFKSKRRTRKRWMCL